MIRCGILTVSDRSSRGERPDLAGPALSQLVNKLGWSVSISGLVPDEEPRIIETLMTWCNSNAADLILTTGGTGFAPRDVTPEATRATVEKETPGLVEAMRQSSLKITPHAMLSRAVAGIRNQVLIVNLPGSPKAAVENLQVIVPIIPHALSILQDSPEAESGHNFG